MSLSIRSWAEILTGLAAGIFIAWLLITKSHVQTQLANQKVETRTMQLRYQAAQASEASCKAALDSIQEATGALVSATVSANHLTDQALQRAQDRSVAVKVDIDRLLGVRAEPGQDCKAATGLAQSAWFEGQ